MFTQSSNCIATKVWRFKATSSNGYHSCTFYQLLWRNSGCKIGKQTVMTVFTELQMGLHWKTSGTANDAADWKWAFFFHFLSTTARQTWMFSYFSLHTALNYAFLGTVDMKDVLCLHSKCASGVSQSLCMNAKMEQSQQCETHICLRWNQMLTDLCLSSSLRILSLYSIYIIHISSSVQQY